jgi:transcriptional regulator with AAA-type ATPase domain
MSQREPEEPEFGGITAEDGPESNIRRGFPFRPHLFLVLECDRLSAGGARYALADLDAVHIGRGPSRSAVMLPGRLRQLDVKVPNQAMSTAHARIVRSGTGWVLEDAGSTNGSFVNGERVVSAELGDGDFIELGHTLFVFRIGIPTPPDAPAVLDSLQMQPPDPALATLLPPLAAAYAELARVAPSTLPITITGRTGTGKEVIARAVHALSGRRGHLVPVNCGALAPNLVESQMFGHVKGAFSGAIRDELGFVRTADEGTLFLDEIGEMPKPAQVAMLRVLQESEVVPVGMARPVKVNLRVIAASQERLSDLVEHGDLRADLQARLDGYAVNLLPLALRTVDLGIIAAGLIRSAGVEPPILRASVARLLFRYEWPLNIREFEQTLRRAITLSGGQPISTAHLPETITDPAAATGPGNTRSPSGRPAGMSDAELRSELVEQLKKHRGNVAAVANAMGKARTQIVRWLQRFDIDPAPYRS